MLFLATWENPSFVLWLSRSSEELVKCRRGLLGSCSILLNGLYVVGSNPG